MIQKRDIIIFGDDWGRHPSTIQHIAGILSKYNRILWIGSLGLRSPRFRLYDLRRIFDKIVKVMLRRAGRAGRGNFVELHPFILPFYDLKLARWLNKLLLRRKILAKIKEINFSDSILLVSTPVACDLVGELKEKSSHYLCFDDYGRFDESFATLKSMEAEILKRVDGCFAVSDTLLKSRHCTSGENHFLPQGVEWEHFQTASEEVPPLIATLERPIVGFFGLITTWVDVELIYKCARAYPSFSFVLIGRSTVDLQKQSGLDNFFYLGEIPYDQLPSYARFFDVGIVPFILNELTVASNPIKILEYLALGLPVISSDLPEARKFNNHVLIAGSDEEFISLIGKAVKTNTPQEKEERRRKAEEYSWERIGAILSSKILKIEEKKRRPE